MLALGAVLAAPVQADSGLLTAGPVLDEEARGQVAAALEVEPGALGWMAPLGVEGDWWASAGVALEGCPDAAPTAALAEVLAEARALRAGLRSEEALTLLGDAWERVPCQSPDVTRGQLTETLELLGQLAQEQRADEVARAAYLDLLAIEPGYRLSTPPGSGYEALFDEVRRARRTASQGRLVLLPALPDEGQRSWLPPRVDGELWGAADRELRWLAAGRHLLVWQTPQGARGAWLRVAEDAPEELALVQAGALEGAAATGPETPALGQALGLLLEQRRAEAELREVVVVTGAEPLSGYRWDGAGFSWWGERDDRRGAGMVPERIRLGLTGGLSGVQGYLYGGVRGALEVRLFGPLHAGLSGGLLVGEPLSLTESEFDGARPLLPELGLTVLARPERGIIQPWGGLQGGLWFAPATWTDPVEQEIRDRATDEELLAQLEQRAPVNGWIGGVGGVDLVPRGGPVVVRIDGGVGYGMGTVWLRVGAGVGFRLLRR